MPDLRQHATACKFYNCSHRHEPGCAVRAAVCPPGADQAPAHSASQTISANRYKIYGDLYAELAAAQKY
jgi:ribosome biogenesis GTPase